MCIRTTHYVGCYVYDSWGSCFPPRTLFQLRSYHLIDYISSKKLIYDTCINNVLYIIHISTFQWFSRVKANQSFNNRYPLSLLQWSMMVRDVWNMTKNKITRKIGPKTTLIRQLKNKMKSICKQITTTLTKYNNSCTVFNGLDTNWICNC